jgi:hypothetical protein
MAEHNGTVRELVARGRSFAERIQTDTCTITIPGAPTLDPDTAVLTDTATELYSGQCRIRPRQVQDRMTEVGADEVGVTAHVVTVPISVVEIPPGAIVTVTASAADPDLVGRQFTILGAIHGSQITGRRMTCQEVTT